MQAVLKQQTIPFVSTNLMMIHVQPKNEGHTHLIKGKIPSNQLMPTGQLHAFFLSRKKKKREYLERNTVNIGFRGKVSAHNCLGDNGNGMSRNLRVGLFIFFGQIFRLDFKQIIALLLRCNILKVTYVVGKNIAVINKR